MYNPFIPLLNSYLHEPQASLLTGILFGVKAHMPQDFYQALVTTGLLHIIALSGMNITILVNLFAKSTLFFGRKSSGIFTIILIIFFVAFVGPSPSIVRAAIMGILSLLSVYFGRQYWALFSLFVTSLLMLLFDLKLATDISFQLSFLATLGIILFGGSRKKTLSEKKSLLERLISPLKENLRLTLSAQLFTLPVILCNFHRISLIAPVANIAVEWVIQPVMVLGFTSAILGWIWQPLGLPVAWLAWVPLTYFIRVVEILSRVPGASVQF